jgi:hypothetical protein
MGERRGAMGSMEVAAVRGPRVLGSRTSGTDEEEGRAEARELTVGEWIECDQGLRV